MLSFLLVLVVAVFVGVSIWILHRNQRRQTVETADRTAPLAPLADGLMPDFRMPAPAPAPASPAAPAMRAADTAVTPAAPAAVLPVAAPPLPTAAGAAEPAGSPPAARTVPEAPTGALPADKWLNHVKTLRDARQFDAALMQCHAQYPRAQAFQQAAIILRQQVREALERGMAADTLFKTLYQTAALADLFRAGNPHKAGDIQQALELFRRHGFSYAAIGHQELKLLNKSDVRAMEQMWGPPLAHRHVEDVLGEEWLALCRASQSAPAIRP